MNRGSADLPVVRMGWMSGNTVDSLVSFVIVVGDGDETTVMGKHRRCRFDDGDDVRDSNGLLVDESRSCSNERLRAMHEAMNSETVRNK